MDGTIYDEQFAEKFTRESVEASLQAFAFAYRYDLPEYLIEDKSSIGLIIDVIPVLDSSVVLPVAIRSTGWLKSINRMEDDLSLSMCLHNEAWPRQNRFEAVVPLNSLMLGDCADDLFNYIVASISHWENAGVSCATQISDRVESHVSEGQYQTLKESVEVVALPEVYREGEVVMLSPPFVKMI